MSDNYTKEVLIMNVSRVKINNTKPEDIIGIYPFSKVWIYRKMHIQLIEPCKQSRKSTYLGVL